jgi:hypothetical protein
VVALSILACAFTALTQHDSGHGYRQAACGNGKAGHDALNASLSRQEIASASVHPTADYTPVLKRETPTTAPSVGAVSRDTSVCNGKTIHQIWVHAHCLKIV